jgi:AcrR family transcriptional regulator
MSPRPYRLGQRQQATTEQTRARILAAAHQLLAAAGGIAAFTVEAVARHADVSRMTVYYQFGSKAGLLEALFDQLATTGGLPQGAAAALGQPDPLDALAGYVAAFGRFWVAERLVLRRLRSLAALDPELEHGVRARDARRRKGLELLAGRLADRYGHPHPDALAEAVTVLHMLTSFETFDALAGPDRSPQDVAGQVHRLAVAALGLPQQ